MSAGPGPARARRGPADRPAFRRRQAVAGLVTAAPGGTREAPRTAGPVAARSAGRRGLATPAQRPGTVTQSPTIGS